VNSSPARPHCTEETLQGLGAAAGRLVPAAGPPHRVASAERLLLDPPGLLRAVRAFGRAAGTDETGVDASLLCQAWAVGVTRAAIASLGGARRVPDLAAANTRLLFDEAHRPVGAAAIRPRFAAMMGDEEAGHDPEAEIVPDDDALFAWTRARLFDGHLGPLVEALHDLVPVGRRLLWGNVAAAVAGGFAALTALAVHPFDPEHVLPEAARLLDEPGSPTAGLAALFPVTHDGATRLLVRRQTDCLRYRLPDAPPTCLSCRLLPERDRRRRITARLEATGR